MKIYVVGNTKNKFLPLDSIRQKFFIDETHNEDNIDNLNKWYSELTGLYYLWKHENDDIAGLEHYRRYFFNEKNQLLSKDEIETALLSHDIICGYRQCVFGKSLEQRFFDGWDYGPLSNELKYLHFAIKYYYPNLYNEFKTFITKNWHYQYNMCICKKVLLNKYCEFLFPLLLIIKESTECKLRSIGYLAEVILLSFFIYINNLKVKFQKIIVFNFKSNIN